MLVGKRVRYRFNKECDGKTEAAWYSGKIISQVLKIWCQLAAIKHSYENLFGLSEPQFYL
jgi:hypothetical protein